MGWPIGRKMAWSYNKHLRRPENHFKPKTDFKAERAKSKFMQHPSSMFHYSVFTVAFTRWTHWTATQALPPPRTRCPSHKVLGFHIVKHAIKILIYDLSDPFWSLEIRRLKHITPFQHLLHSQARACVHTGLDLSNVKLYERICIKAKARPKALF